MRKTGETQTPVTERLYDEDPYIQEFQAKVIACESDKKGYAVQLDRTAFFPEGGGQAGDSGVLEAAQADLTTDLAQGEAGAAARETFPAGEGQKSGARTVTVRDTQEKDGRVLHICDRPIPAGSTVHGKIDWDARFDRMQNHSGEHIVSGLIHAAYGYNNVGFHMGTGLMTIDLDGELTAAQVREIERRANEVVWKDVTVQTRVYTEEEARSVEYRSKKELHGLVRVVTIPGADVCACCGTHVSTTGQIGLIRIVSQQRFKGGVRLEMVCGRRALDYVEQICDQNHLISVALSARPLRTAEAVEKLKKQENEEAFRLIGMENERFAQIAKEMAQAGDICLFEEGLGPESVRKLAVAVMEENHGAVAAVFSGSDEDGYKYAIGQKDGNVRDLTKTVNAQLSGRGGGKPFFSQGGVQATRAQIRALMEEQGMTVR